MRIIMLVLAALAVQSVWGQLHTPPLRPVQTGPDFDNVLDRVSGSEFVVKGKVLDLAVVPKRLPLAELGRLSIEDKFGGTLFTIEPRETVCRQSDFSATASQAAPLAGLVYIFVPWREPRTPGKDNPYRWIYSESLAKGREYLLFLRRNPRQDELVKDSQLDPGLIYYRTYEGDRGAVELPEAARQGQPRDFITPLVSAVTALCEAVKAPDVETKIRNLNAVRDHSTDVAWRQSVDAAIKALQQAQTREPVPR